MNHPVLRRLCLVAGGALAVLLLAAFTSQGALPISLDLSGMFAKMVYGALGLVGAALLWMAQQVLSTLKSLDDRVSDASRKLTTISHELFGVTGTNGMRSEVRENTRLLQRHGKVLVVLADREGVDFNEG